MIDPPPSAFSADAAHVTWFGSRVLRAVAASPPRRVLDIGCGDGSLLLYLAAALPAASLLGVDLSHANVAAAAAAIDDSPHRGRVNVVENDYLTLDAGRFDLVVASSSLQGLPAPTERLAATIARDVAPAGRLIHVTPYRCLHNGALNAARLVLRAARGPATDHMILTLARALHPDQPRMTLTERVGYMYLVLRHYEEGLRAALERRGFTVDHIEPAPHTSIGQPKHRLVVMSAPERP